MEMVKVTIDGKQVEVPKTATVLAAAKSVGVDIPTLCHLNLHDINMVNKSASCRICVVEVEGKKDHEVEHHQERDVGLGKQVADRRLLRPRRNDAVTGFLAEDLSSLLA